jgi:hypothetical protein
MFKLITSFSIALLLFSSCKVQNKTETPAGNDNQSTGKTELQNEKTDAEWREFVSSEGRFKIDFPGVPQETVEESDWEGKKVAFHHFEVTRGRFRFEMTYADFPGSAVKEPEKIRYNLDYRRDSLIEQSKEKLVSERDVRLDDWTGREFVLTDGDQTDAYQIYKIGDRNYQISVAYNNKPAPEKEVFQKAMDYYFSTLEISKK